MKSLIIISMLATAAWSSNQLNFDHTIKQIKHHEGFRSHFYIDNNHYSIGYGINLSHITRAEANMLLIHRLAIKQAQLQSHSWYKNLSSVRKQIVLNMSYQIGYAGILKFKHMIWRLKHNYWNAAANAMISSKWYRQSGNRSRQLVKAMRSNSWNK